jgi:alkylation response protein AidB-like acyl-CoA dehydrogenase
MTDDERRGFDNLILLCDEHHVIIDNKANEEVYPTSLLKIWKSEHEKKMLELISNKNLLSRHPLSLNRVINLIGEEGQGFALAQERLGPGRIHHCMRWIGICERALEMMCRRALSRELDPGKPLANQQTIQNWIAEAAAGIKASRLLVMMTAHKIEQEGAKAAKEDISTIKFFVSDVLMTTIDKAIQVHGALGITDDTLLSFWYRHERGARIYDGPDEVHKSVLAKRILKNYSQE